MSYWLVQVLNGLSLAMLLFLVAAGLSLVMGLMRIVNVAHGMIYPPLVVISIARQEAITVSPVVEAVALATIVAETMVASITIAEVVVTDCPWLVPIFVKSIGVILRCLNL